MSLSQYPRYTHQPINPTTPVDVNNNQRNTNNSQGFNANNNNMEYNQHEMSTSRNNEKVSNRVVNSLPIIYDGNSRSRVIHDTSQLNEENRKVGQKARIVPSNYFKNTHNPDTVHQQSRPENGQKQIHVQQDQNQYQYSVAKKEGSRIVLHSQITNQPIYIDAQMAMNGNHVHHANSNSNIAHGDTNNAHMNSNQKQLQLLSNESVPRIHYQRCVNECKNWETRYNQLYLKFMSLAQDYEQLSVATPQPQGDPQVQQQVHHLERENQHLRTKLNSQNEELRDTMKVIEADFSAMVIKQQQATTKEAMLLLERYRLQCKREANYLG